MAGPFATALAAEAVVVLAVFAGAAVITKFGSILEAVSFWIGQ